MSDRKFKRFGRYLILDHLVDGGMAQIFGAPLEEGVLVSLPFGELPGG